MDNYGTFGHILTHFTVKSIKLSSGCYEDCLGLAMETKQQKLV